MAYPWRTHRWFYKERSDFSESFHRKSCLIVLRKRFIRFLGNVLLGFRAMFCGGVANGFLRFCWHVGIHATKVDSLWYWTSESWRVGFAAFVVAAAILVSDHETFHRFVCWVREKEIHATKRCFKVLRADGQLLFMICATFCEGFAALDGLTKKNLKRIRKLYIELKPWIIQEL